MPVEDSSQNTDTMSIKYKTCFLWEGWKDVCNADNGWATWEMYDKLCDTEQTQGLQERVKYRDLRYAGKRNWDQIHIAG